LYDIYVNLTASRSLLIDDESICITSCIGIQPVVDQINVATQFCNNNVYFIFEYRFHKRARNLLQAFSRCLQEVYFFLKRYSHVNDISILEMLMKWFEKDFSNMRLAIGWVNSQTWDDLVLDRNTLNMRRSWDALLLDKGILSIRYLCDALLLEEGIIKHKVLCYWMSELSSMICSWDVLLFDEGILKHKILCYSMTEFTNMRCFTVVWGNSSIII
jgi:hypothetical protein